MRIALYGTPFSEQYTKYIQYLVTRLENENVQIIGHKDYLAFLQGKIIFQSTPSEFDAYESLKNNADYLFSIGGDGTLLSAITLIRDSNIPIIGINTGRLGFIASVSTDQLDATLTDLFKQNYQIKQRALLCLESENHLFGNENFALNEVAILKKDSSSMIQIDVFLDDEFLNSYRADGLVVSTPTGSTGYSLSSGGPIVMPGTNNIIITPIAPHNLNVRPFVLSDKNILRLKVVDRAKIALVALDSRFRSFETSTEFTIKAADFRINLVEFASNSFISTIRNKLMWGIDKRS